MTQNMAYFAIIDEGAAMEPVPIRGWTIIPLTQDRKQADGTITAHSLTEEELLQQVTPHMPAGSRAIRLHVTDEDWNARPVVNPVLSKGGITQGKTPSTTLRDQAAAMMLQVQQQAAMAAAMGETFGPKMRACVSTLRAILDGSDTPTSLPTLPARPTD
ncbi:hypothetical protein [Bombella apis]|uniref:hypothetical protein n=1 Tax=Bombella apis TaxID=1785988 RepID=UPI0023FA2F97|nr:hypothetical protein [Bombella apis]MCT6813095.1 hypothetical protein [Bombella apis]